MKIIFIIKGLIKNKQKLLSTLKKNFPESDQVETKFSLHAIDLAKNAVEKSYTHIIAVGGDGTLSEVVNGILLSGKEKLPILGLLSYGTANDFSKTVKLDGSIEQLKNLIEGNSPKKIDIGKIHYTKLDDKPAERYFINIADIGIGGCIVENINKSKKILGANGTFFLETLKAMFTYKRTTVKFSSEEFNWQGKTLSMVIANGKYFGSGLCIAPDADLSDGKFSTVILGDVTVLDYLKNISKVKKGEKIINPQVFYNSARKVEIFPLEAPCPIDVDGEFIGYAPATFTVLPQRITFLMP